MKRIRYCPNANLPQLAWCAQIIKSQPAVTVYHGPGIETNGISFVEGVWSGEFSEKQFAEAVTFTGSGGCLVDSGVLFASSTHTLQPIYLLRSEDSLSCSNSMAFLLAAAGDDVDTGYKYYDYDFMSIMYGLKRYVTRIPTRRRATVEQCYYCNLTVDQNLHVIRQKKADLAPFTSFAHYHDVLKREISQLAQNAHDRHRRTQYEPLTTISSGYDSPACAVLAKGVGCQEAVTFTTAADHYADREDSGKEIAEILKLQVTEYDPQTYLGRTDLPEAEFVATGAGGDDVVMSCLEGRLSGRMLFTGYHGDKVWDRANKKAGPDMVRGDPSGCSLQEFRLRVGFINLPVPFIGCVQHASIYEISNSEEMNPWKVDFPGYDRPIPRRIVEEAGVPRGLFAQRKKAIAMPYQTTGLTNPPLNRVISPSSYEDLSAFLDGKKLYDGFLDRLHTRYMRAVFYFNLRLLRSVKLEKLLKSLGLKVPDWTWKTVKYGKDRSPHNFVFHWGIQKILNRYNGFLDEVCRP